VNDRASPSSKIGCSIELSAAGGRDCCRAGLDAIVMAGAQRHFGLSTVLCALQPAWLRGLPVVDLGASRYPARRATPGGLGSLLLRAKCRLRFSSCREIRASPGVGRLVPPGLRGAVLVGVPRIRPDVAAPLVRSSRASVPTSLRWLPGPRPWQAPRALGCMRVLMGSNVRWHACLGRRPCTLAENFRQARIFPRKTLQFVRSQINSP